jgi:glycosyltransferase involved in cell wall biosynthesis
MALRKPARTVSSGSSPADRTRLRVVYYSSSVQLEPVLSLTPEMSRRTEFHLLLELSPEAWSSALFDVPPQRLPSGIQPGDAALRDTVPPTIRSHWQRSSSFHVVVHNCPRSLHPRTWWVSLQAARFIRSLRPDVLHLDNSSLRMAPALWLLRDIPMVLTLHDPEPHSGEDNWRIQLGRWLTSPWIDRYLLLSKLDMDHFGKRFEVSADRLDFARLGIHAMCKEWMREWPTEESRTVLFFGRLSPYKGLEVFYDAARIVAQRLDSVRFVVAGRPVPGYVLPPPPELPNGARVEVIERYLHNRETAELFARSTAVACPYLDATQSGVVLTAFAFGKPVVATRVGGLPDYVVDGVHGLLVDPGDANGLATALISLLESDALRCRLRAGIEAAAQTTLSWATTAEHLVDAYRRAVTK